MSELPTIASEAVYQRLYTNLSTKDRESERQLAHLELLAEALRDQRDALQTRLDSTTPDEVEGVVTGVTNPPPMQ